MRRIGCRGAPGPETQHRLKGGHRLLPTVVPKHELVKVDLELPTTDTVMGADQSLLEIANRTVRQGDNRFGSLAQVLGRWLRALDMLEAGARQAGELLQPIGVDRRPRRDMLPDNGGLLKQPDKHKLTYGLTAAVPPSSVPATHSRFTRATR